MAIDFADGTLTFVTTTGQVATSTSDSVFATPVKKARAVMTSFDVGFKNGDHPIHEIQAEVSGVSIDPVNAAVVHVTGALLLRDASGNIDDPFQGGIGYTVIAEV